MTLVRRSILEQIGGWAPWCITEDAELGLRILAQGYTAVYVPVSYGRGVMPDRFDDYKRQRHRWAYGAMTILRRSASLLTGRTPSRLSPGQRYHFVAGWIPWLADALNLVFASGAVLWSVAMLVAPSRVIPPSAELCVPPIALFLFRLVKTLTLYRLGWNATWREAGSAALAGLALSHTVALAVIAGLLRQDRPFSRTPKWSGSLARRRDLEAVRGEAGATAALWACATGLLVLEPMPGRDLWAWLAMLLVLSLPYAAALVLACASHRPLSARWLGRTHRLDAAE
jgi:hypothetical protein